MKVVIVTNVGNIEIKLFTNLVPLACCKFIELVVDKKYNGTQFQRVIKGFMIQGGDVPSATTVFPDEVNTLLTYEKPWRVAFANCGPNTNRAQFFITTVPCPHLNGKYTQFGEVVAGRTTVQLIENESTIHGKPIVEKVIIDTYVEKE